MFSTMHSGRRLRFRCYVCNNVFSTMVGLSTHYSLCPNFYGSLEEIACDDRVVEKRTSLPLLENSGTFFELKSKSTIPALYPFNQSISTGFQMRSEGGILYSELDSSLMTQSHVPASCLSAASPLLLNDSSFGLLKPPVRMHKNTTKVIYSFIEDFQTNEFMEDIEPSDDEIEQERSDGDTLGDLKNTLKKPAGANYLNIKRKKKPVTTRVSQHLSKGISMVGACQDKVVALTKKHRKAFVDDKSSIQILSFQSRSDYALSCFAEPENFIPEVKGLPSTMSEVKQEIEQDNINKDITDSKSSSTIKKYRRKNDSEKNRLVVPKRSRSQPERFFPCSKCGRLFIQRQIMAAHYKIHLKENRLKCCICRKKFRYKCLLLSHLRSHPGIKNRVCFECNVKFSNKSNLNSHVRRLHSGERPFSCEVCSRPFYRRWDMKKHIRTHSAKKNRD